MPDDLPPPSESDRDWHWRDQEPDEKAAPPETERRQRFVVLTLLIAALGGIGIGVASWFFRAEKDPAFVLSLIVWQHSDPLYPAHDVALEDSAAVLQHFKELTAAQRRAAKQSQAREDLESELRRLAKQKEGPVIVHVSCLARTRGGVVYLLASDADLDVAADADPEKAGRWLKLSTVLEYVNKCEAKDKLLILDIAHPLADTRLGIVVDDVAEGVKKTLDNQAGSSLLVLNSCGPGQTALTSPMLTRSVFAHFVDQGLRGSADVWNADGEANKRVTVKELAAYVRTQTESWAKKNHGAKQTPWLWGQGDFALVDLTVRRALPDLADLAKKAELAKKMAEDAAKKGEPEGKADDKKPADKAEPPPKWEFPAPLKAAWKLREKLAGFTRPRLPAAVLLQFDVQLLHAEKNWRGGRPQDERAGAKSETELGKVVKQLGKWEAKLAAPAAIPAWEAPPPSLAIAMMQHAEPAEPLVKRLQETLKELTVGAAKQLDTKERQEQDKKEEKIKTDAETEILKQFKEAKLPTEVQQVAALIAALRLLPNPNRLQTVLVHETVEKLLKGQSPGEYVETAWLKRARAFDLFIRQDTKVQTEWEWPAAAIGQSLRTLSAAESLAALLGQDPELLHWLGKERFPKAEENRREGERLLFWGKPSQWKKDVVPKLSQAAQDYEAMHAALSQVRAARSAYQRALVQMPGCYLWLIGRPESNAEEDATAWSEAVELTGQVAKQLATAPNPQNTAAIQGESLVKRLDRLANRQQTTAEDFIRRGKELAPGDLATMQALRASAGLTVEQRAGLWRTFYELADDLHGKFQPAAQASRLVSLSPLPRLEEDWKQQIKAGRVRAELALDLMTLAGDLNLDQARNNLKELANPAPLPAFEKLGLNLRDAWKQLRDAEAKTPRATAFGNCLKCFVPVLGGEGQADPVDVEPDGKWSNDVKDWLSNRFRSEAGFLKAFDGNPDYPTDSKFFSKTAERLSR